MLTPLIVILATSQIAAPAGTAKITARQSTKIVRSIIEVYMVCKIRGGRYGGSSRLNVETSPFSTVRESAQDTMKVRSTPKSAMPKTADAEIKPA